MTAESERRQRRVGTVVSNRSDKTIAVQVEAVRRHPLYRKPVRIRRKVLAHDAENTCEVGDVVEIVASRPYSRRKRWRLTRVMNRATLTEEEQAAVAAASEAAIVVDAEPEVEEVEETADDATVALATADADVEADAEADESESEPR